MAQLMEMFQEYGIDRYVIIGGAVLGVLILLAGYRVFHVAVDILGFLISGGVFAGFMYYMFQPPLEMLAVILALGGILGAYFANHMYKAGVFILSGIMGGFIIYWLTNDEILTLAGGLLIAIVAVVLEKVILIITTSLAGSFLFANMVKGYAEQPQQRLLIEAGILALVGMIFQFLTNRKKKVEETEENEAGANQEKNESVAVESKTEEAEMVSAQDTLDAVAKEAVSTAETEQQSVSDTEATPETEQPSASEEESIAEMEQLSALEVVENVEAAAEEADRTTVVEESAPETQDVETDGNVSEEN